MYSRTWENEKKKEKEKGKKGEKEKGKKGERKRKRKEKDLFAHRRENVSTPFGSVERWGE